MQAFNIIRRALLLANVTAANESPDATMAADGLETLNDMVSDWATQKLTIPAVTRATFPLVALQGTYTIGESGTPDFSAVRPEWINNMSIIPVGNDNEIPLVLYTRDQYAAEPIKSLQSSFPTKVLYEPTVPNGTLTFWPIPDTAPTFVLYVPTIISEFATLTTEYIFPRGYVKALRYQLALEFCTEYGRPVDAMLLRQAEQSFGNIKRKNIQQDELEVDDALLARTSIFNYYTGNCE